MSTVGVGFRRIPPHYCVVRPVGARSAVQVRIPPGSGKGIVNAKGVHREVESEERRRRISGLTNRNLIRLSAWIRLQSKLKSYNYTEMYLVDETDRWRERTCEYPGRSRQQMETEYEDCSNNEWREVSRGHSTMMVANIMGRTEL